MAKKTDAPRALFNTRLGVIATTVGSAVGLGNIWRFPYEAGTHGGAAFILCYVGFIFLLGVPVICAEFILGRGTHSNILRAYCKLSPGRWYWAGYLGILASVLILSFYSVVAGWTVEYFVQSAAGSLDLGSVDAYHDRFDTFATGNWRPLIWTLAFLAINYFILIRGVTAGIERMSNILMPVLFVLLIALCVNSLTLPAATEGLKFMFSPDFSKITPSTLLGAMGQAFFSLSLGLGCMATYASYFRPSTRLVRSAAVTASLDTAVALLSGIVIFPAVFSFGFSPQAGPTLVFEVLPAVFHSLPAGAVWSAIFFFLLVLASLTSTISMSEISIAWLVEEKGVSRKRATTINTAVATVLGTLCTLSFGCLNHLRVFGLTIFELFDYTTSNILLPVGGMISAIFVGWIIDRRFVRNQLTNRSTLRMRVLPVIVFCLRYIAPAAIALVLLNSLGIL